MTLSSSSSTPPTYKHAVDSVDLTTSAKYEVLFSHLSNLRVKDVRQLFCKMRNESECDANILFPAYGFTVGEFTLGQVFNMPNRSKKTTDANKGIVAREKLQEEEGNPRRVAETNTICASVVAGI
jgi:hypothetical protein